MKVIQPFFLGGVCGLALAIAIAAALFASPLRKGLYLDLDPEISDLRAKMGGLQERLMSDEMGIAEAESADSTVRPAVRATDSLKASQAGAWKEYRHWRNRLGELSRQHELPRPGEFADWAISLRYVLGPFAAILFLIPAVLLGVRGARQSRSRPARAPARPAQTQAEAMTSFESAVKQVARIAAAGGPEAAPAAEGRGRQARSPASEPVARDNRTGRPGRPSQGNREATEEKDTEYLPEVPRRNPPAAKPAATPAKEPSGPEPRMDAPRNDIFQVLEPSPYDVSSGNVFQEPETSALPMNAMTAMTGDAPPAGREIRPEGMETQIIKLGPGGWGEARPNPVPVPESASARPAAGLSMEDEEEGAAPESEDPPPGTFMPPTTEVERVERRKSEVLKLARKGLTSSEISKRMRISQDQVEFIIRLRREKG